MSPRAPVPFWVMPPGWVWCLFLFSMVLLTASMLTLREGTRFLSRPLSLAERAIVVAALDAWEGLEGPQARARTDSLRDLLAQERIRAMREESFDRPRERNTFGYTDERGRILLNPHRCFVCLRLRGARVQTLDVVVTLSTLVHEDEHRVRQASEREAYEVEWLFLRRVAAQPGPWQEELARWEGEMPERVGDYLGLEELAPMQQRVEHAPRLRAAR